MTRLSLALLTMLWLSQPSAARPYTIPDTQVHTLHSKFNGVTYELLVALPSGYRTSGTTYPVVYMLDADYSFALVRNIVEHFVDRGDLPPMILVAIAYPGAASNREIYRLNRTRDYTPVFAPDGGYGTQYQKVSGGGGKFKSFISRELFAFMARHYRADPADRTLIGHSFGGLFATYVLLREPALFTRYIIVSPSLWYANRIAFTMEETAAASGTRPRARVFLGVGQLENSQMPGDLKTLYNRLQSPKYPDLKVSMRVFEHERHNSVFPGAVTTGLQTIFDRPPATSPSAPSTPQSDRAQ